MYARISKDRKRKQLLEEHLTHVQLYAIQKTHNVHLQAFAGLIGYLHDIGKLFSSWQAYLLKNKKTKMEHAKWGACFLYHRYYQKTLANEMMDTIQKSMLMVAMNVILSHHGILRNALNADGTSDVLDKVQQYTQTDIEELEQLIEKHLVPLTTIDRWVEDATAGCFTLTTQQIQLVRTWQNGAGKKEARKMIYFYPLLTHHMYSVLVDADSMDAANFEQVRNKMPTMQNDTLMAKAESHLAKTIESFKCKSDRNYIDDLRQEISDACFAAAEQKPGLYRLSTPVGAGKTISSLRYGLRHAKTYKKKRIFYILPFTAIIEQNAQDIRDILEGENFIVEHHGQVVQDKHQDITLAKENWDAPIVITTMYQFMMAFYGGGRRNLRRLHHLTNSVVIFDEVQAIPMESISLFNEVVNYLVEIGESTVVLCTATQPTLEHIKEKLRMPIRNLLPNDQVYEKSFKRVSTHDLGNQTTESLIPHITQSLIFQSVLVILNTKKAVRTMYDAIPRDNFYVYHLSTSMCPAHRKRVLRKVKAHLRKQERVLLLSTPLIEAGVNISFPILYRSMAGLDNMEQAKGRCNRNGETVGHMFFFHHTEEKIGKLQSVHIGRQITRRCLHLLRAKKGHTDSLFTMDMMQVYYRNYYNDLGLIKDYRFEQTTLHAALFNKVENDNTHVSAQHETVLSNYMVYNVEHIPVLTPYDTGLNFIRDLRAGITSPTWEKDCIPYTVNLFPEEFDKLNDAGCIEEVTLANNRTVYILTSAMYHHDKGVLL